MFGLMSGFKYRLSKVAVLTTVSAFSGHYFWFRNRYENKCKQMVANIQPIRPQFVFRSTALMNGHQDLNPKTPDELQLIALDSFVRIFNLFTYTPEEMPRFGIGSGFCVRQSGYIVTNCHVVSNSTELYVEKFVVETDGGIYGTGLSPIGPFLQIVYVDPRLELALLRITEQPLDVNPVQLATDVNVGEPLVSIGNPIGLIFNQTHGLVNAFNGFTGYECSRATYEYIHHFIGLNVNQIRHTCPIYYGSSGGPLFNMHGQVVGVNWGGLEMEDLDFAVPSTVINEFIDNGFAFERQFLNNKHSFLAIKSLAIAVQPYDNKTQIKICKNLNIKDINDNSPPPGAGLAVINVLQDISPTNENKFKMFDVIKQIDGKPVNTVQEIRDLIGNYSAGQMLAVTLIRWPDISSEINLNIKLKPIDCKVI